MSEIRSYAHQNGGTVIAAHFGQDEFLSARRAEDIICLIADKIATRYVEEHFAEIAARLDQNAIANLAVAEAGKKIAEEIKTRPVILREKTTHVHNSIF